MKGFCHSSATHPNLPRSCMWLPMELTKMLAWISMVQLVQIHDLSTERHHIGTMFSPTLQRQSCAQIGKMAYCMLMNRSALFFLSLAGTVECSKVFVSEELEWRRIGSPLLRHRVFWTEDMSKGFHWIQKAAEMGHVEAQNWRLEVTEIPLWVQCLDQCNSLCLKSQIEMIEPSSRAGQRSASACTTIRHTSNWQSTLKNFLEEKPAPLIREKLGLP